ncbi:MAG: trigger factor [Clostridiales bacterium]|nr:trigger factor [Clostridiales bacterium]
MNVTTCEKKDAGTAELAVEVSAEEFDKALNEAYKKNKSQIAVPGFRKGKAPRKIIEAMYGASVFYNDALDAILPAVCSHGVSESNLKTVGYPKILDMNINDDKSATIKYSVELYPEIQLESYKGLSAVKQPVQVEESNIDSEIAAVQLRNARIQTATRPAIGGDTAVIDFEGFIDGVPFEGGKGENYELVLGSNSFIPGFEAKINGMTVGEERELDLIFPEDYHQKELAGKPVIFKVNLKEVKEKILPELDDEFAKDVSEFDTLQEYRDSIRGKLTAAKKEESEKAFEDAVLGKLADSYECDVPEAMIQDYADNQMEGLKRQLAQYGMEIDMYLNMMGTDAEGFRSSIRPNAVRQIKTTLALEKIAKLEKLEPAEEDIEAYYTDMASRYGVDVKVAKESIPVETVKNELNLRGASKLVCEHAIAEEPAAEEAEPAVKEKKTKKAKAEEKSDDAEPVKADEAVKAEKKTVKKAAPKKAAEKAKTEENPA